jgi:membrane protease YdiL (CAAX protease family)
MNWERESFLRRHPVVSYFLLTFAVSWTGALCVAAPPLLRHDPLPKLTGVLMFPAMLIGPFLAGILLTGMLEGKSGVAALFSRTFRARFRPQWLAVLLLPPVVILGVLFNLKVLISPVYTLNLFLIGILFGVPAGFFEEIGWTGFVFKRMNTSGNALGASILLGLLWCCWHLPVVNYLGTTSPHGDYWLPYFLAFTLAMTAMRVLICWLYSNTKSVLIAQLMHMSSTGSLVIFSATRASAAQEVLWYLVYGAALWVCVVLVVRVYGKELTRQAVNCDQLVA